MKNAYVLRVTGDLCLYFALAAQIRAFSDFAPAMGVFLLLAAAGFSIAVRIPKGFLRSLPVLLPALVFTRVTGIYGVIFFAAPLLYCFLTAALGKLELRHWEYYRSFRVTMMIAAAFLGTAAVQGKLWAAFFSLLHLLFGVIALRNLRMEAEMPLKWRGMNLAGVILPFLAAAGISRVFYAFLGVTLKFLTVLVAPELAGILAVQDALGRFTNYLYDKIDEAASQAESTAESTEMATKALEDVAGNDTDLPRWMENIRINRMLAAILLVAAAAGVLIFLMIRRHHAEEEEEAFVEEGSRANVQRRKRRRKEKYSSNAEKVRRIYRDYMELISHYGVIPERDTTSEDLMHSSSDICPAEPNSGLREIYLRARYGRGDNITDEDLKTAEGYLGNLTEAVRKQ